MRRAEYRRPRLAKLADKKRVVFVLHELEGMSPTEIADVVEQYRAAHFTKALDRLRHTAREDPFDEASAWRLGERVKRTDVSGRW